MYSSQTNFPKNSIISDSYNGNNRIYKEFVEYFSGDVMRDIFSGNIVYTRFELISTLLHSLDQTTTFQKKKQKNIILENLLIFLSIIQ